MVHIPKLREVRELRGLTQKELADLSGVSVRGIAGYEGGASVRPNTTRKLARALDVEVTDLAGVDAYPKDPALSLDAKAIAPFEEETLFMLPYTPEDFDEVWEKALDTARKARLDYIPRGMQLVTYDDGDSIEVRAEPISHPTPSPRRRTSRTKISGRQKTK